MKLFAWLRNSTTTRVVMVLGTVLCVVLLFYTFLQGKSTHAAFWSRYSSSDSLAQTPQSFMQTQKLAPEIQRDVKRLVNPTTEGLVEKEMPDGSTILPLEGRFRHVPVATIDENGNISIREYSNTNYHTLDKQ